MTAARSLGARDIRILTREILPNVLPPMASSALLAIAIVIVAEGSLSFLGLSVTAPTATWGNLINGGRDSLNDAVDLADALRGDSSPSCRSTWPGIACGSTSM